jgi:hypothetical protein
VEGSRVWVHLKSADYEWDYEIIDSFSGLSNAPPNKLHPSGTILWDIGLSRVQEIASGKILFQLNAGLGRPSDVQWNDQCLVACFISGKVLVIDFSDALLR